MLMKPLTLAAAVAGFAAAASAFLLPPDIDAAAVDVLPFDAPHVAESQDVKLNCPGCPLRAKGHHGGFHLKQGIQSHLDLNFTIDHQPQGDRLLVNGFELYPSPDPLNNVFTAPQIPDFKDGQRGGPKAPRPHRNVDALEPRLGFSLQVRTVTKDKANQMELLALDLQILEVGTSFVDGIPNVHISLIRTTAGALMIGDVQTPESQTIQANPMDKQEECTTVLCKWKAIIADKLSHMKPHKCGGKMGKTAHHKGQGKGKAWQHGHHGHHNHHHSGRPHRQPLHEHSWSQLFKKLGSHILFPVLVGIVAGVSISM